MKKVVFISSALLLSSVISQACPDLGGTYKAKSSTADRVATQVVKQSVESGNTVYVFGNGAPPMIADGQIHQSGPVSYVATCDGDSKVSITISAQGQTFLASAIKTTDGYDFLSADSSQNESYLKQ